MFFFLHYLFYILLLLNDCKSEPQNVAIISDSTFSIPGFGSTNNNNVGISTTNRVGFLQNIFPPRFTFSFGLRSNFGQCSTSVIQLGHNKIKVSPRPVGQCDTCCPLQIDQHIRFLLYTRTVETGHNTSFNYGNQQDVFGGVTSPGYNNVNDKQFNNGGNDLRRRRMYEEGSRRSRQRFSRQQSFSERKYQLSGYLSQSEPFEKLSVHGFNPDLKTVIFIHGFLEVVPGASGNTIIEGYASRNESYNIIILDWSMLTTAPWYAQAIINARFTGKVLATFLEHYHSNKELSIDNVHIVGFSLGAHVAGIAGKFLRVKGQKVARITGLDPAFPGFQIKDRRSRLTYSDAIYVDVIHTDASLLGFPVPIGHADFYPNYFNPPTQQMQPGCQINQLLSRNSIDDIISCSHQRAWYLFSESTKNPGSFPATRCRDWYSKNRSCDFTQDAVMGFGSIKENTPRGTYFLVTHAQRPFSMTEGEQRQVRNI